LHVTVGYAVEFESFFQLHTFTMHARLLALTGPWDLWLQAYKSQRSWEVSSSCQFFALVKGVQALLPPGVDTESWQPHITYPFAE
jgi:hypothetical protein